MTSDDDDSAPTPAPALRLRRATGDDLAAVERLLRAAGLPTEDVRDGDARFWLASTSDATEPAAAGGLEPAGEAALLRSVAVAASRRGEGIGTALVDALEGRAADGGIRTLVLLTTDAAGFFAARGYERVDRDGLPEPLRSTPQVDSICPDSAVVMRKRL